jgi:hypothetical protein
MTRGLLDTVRVAVTAMGNRIVLARFGKDPDAPLEARDAGREVLDAVVSHFLEEHPEGGTKVVGGGDRWATITVTPRGRPAEEEVAGWREERAAAR